VRTLHYEVWDVFTRERLTGNQLSVFLDAGGLTDSEMLAIAREMNYSETTFVFPRAVADELKAGVEVKIYLKTGEIAFAGHPVLGTAFALHARNPRARVLLKLKEAAVPVEFTGAGADLEGEMLQPEPSILEKHDPAKLARWAGLPASAVLEEPPVQCASTGRYNILAMLRTVGDLARVRFDWAAIDADPAAKDRGFYLMAAAGPGRFRARKMLRDGEDPVTGSAGGAAIAWLVEHGVVKPGVKVRIEQGIEMHRPGWMMVSAEKTDKVTRVRVGGAAVRAAEGVLTL
jgi:trans-2,3-dihydro-3-hydroxyanthranilate isomerase